MYMKNEIKSYNMLKQRVFGQKLKNIELNLFET